MRMFYIISLVVIVVLFLVGLQISRWQNWNNFISQLTIRNPSLNDNGDILVFASNSPILLSRVNNISNTIKASYPSNKIINQQIYYLNFHTDSFECISIAIDGGISNNHCFYPKISNNGRYIGFRSHANDLVSGVTRTGGNGIFVRDLKNESLMQLDVNRQQRQARSSATRNVAFSKDCQVVAFSDYSGLFNDVIMKTITSRRKVYIRDIRTNIIDNIDGEYVGALNGDGRYIVLSVKEKYTKGSSIDVAQCYRYDRKEGSYYLLSQSSAGLAGNKNSSVISAMSSDGRFVAFCSEASNLVADDNNGVADVFVHDCLTGNTERVSIASDGTEGNAPSGNYGVAMSNDGRFVAFNSASTTFVNGPRKNRLFIYDRKKKETINAYIDEYGNEIRTSEEPDGGIAFSGNGRYLAFAYSRIPRLYIFDRTTLRSKLIKPY